MSSSSKGGCGRDRDKGRKWESGASKERKKRKADTANEPLRSSMKKFLGLGSATLASTSTSNAEVSVTTTNESESTQTDAQKGKEELDAREEIGKVEVEGKGKEETEVEVGETEEKMEGECDAKEDESETSIDSIKISSSDIGKWQFPVTDQQRCYLVEKGVQQLEKADSEYPMDKDKRHFSNSYYSRTLKNGEIQPRRWLAYSESKDCVFCFSCRLFSTSRTQMCETGFSNWQNLSLVLKRHENSKDHIESMLKWLELQERLKCGKTLDKELQTRILKSQQHWQDLFERLIDIVNFLASHNLPFRGHREEITDKSSKNSGNFIGLFKLIAKRDGVLSEHLRRIEQHETRTHYLSHEIQNEVIALMANSVRQKIVDSAKESKYYSIMVDCTRDASKTEQMTIILRFCNISTGEIEEHFLGFLPALHTTGAALSDLVLQELLRVGLDIQNCRGQGYDNGANMVGVNKGVKTRILNINPRAFFTPCGCHSWNLLLVDAASSSAKASTFFGFIQKIYNLFSRSSKRWELLKKLKIKLKSLSETRWESRHAAVRAILSQYDDVLEAIEKLEEESQDPETLSDCAAVKNQMLTLEFVLSMHIWYEILLRVNAISKTWQSVEIHLNKAVDDLETFCEWIKKFRLTGFQQSLQETRKFIENSEYNISPEFKKKDF